MIHILPALPRGASNGFACGEEVTCVGVATAGPAAADLTGVPQAWQNLVSSVTAAPQPVQTWSAAGCGCEISGAGFSTMTVVAVEAEEVSFVSSTLGVTGVALDGAAAAPAAPAAAIMVVAVVVFVSVVTGLESPAAGWTAVVMEAPQERQNLLPAGFDDLHKEHCAPVGAAVCVGAVSTLPHAEQNRFPGGLPAPQAGHNESGWPAMKAPWAQTSSKFMENYILAGIEVKLPNHEFFLPGSIFVRIKILPPRRSVGEQKACVWKIIDSKHFHN